MEANDSKLGVPVTATVEWMSDEYMAAVAANNIRLVAENRRLREALTDVADELCEPIDVNGACRLVRTIQDALATP